MPKFSKKSLERLHECHENLQLIASQLIEEMDVVVLCGHRNKADQNAAYARGTSKVKWPNSKHNKTPSLAVDMAPYPIDWNDLERFKEMRTRIARIAKALGIKIRTISWDWPHTELV